MAEQKKQESRPVPRLIKAADLAARKAKEELKLESLLKKASTVRPRINRTPRDARDARAMFESLFDKPAQA